MLSHPEVTGAVAEGRPFVRRILLGPFQSTTEVDYCDPESGYHDD